MWGILKMGDPKSPWVSMISMLKWFDFGWFGGTPWPRKPPHPLVNHHFPYFSWRFMEVYPISRQVSASGKFPVERWRLWVSLMWSMVTMAESAARRTLRPSRVLTFTGLGHKYWTASWKKSSNIISVPILSNFVNLRIPSRTGATLCQENA